MKSEVVADLPKCVTDACMAVVRKEGPSVGREIMRHLKIELEQPKSLTAAKVLADLYERIEAHLVGDP